MGDSSNASGAAGQEPAAPGPQDGTEGKGQEPSSVDSGGTSIDDVKTLQKELDKARQEAAGARAELKAAKDADKVRKDAEKAETERLTARTLELETENKRLALALDEALLTANVMVHASRLGIVDPDAAVKLLDKDALERDEEGRPKDVESALRELLKARPYLAGKPGEAPPPPSSNAGAGTQGAPGPRLTAEEQAAAKATGMDPSRYAALKGAKTLDDWRRATTKPS